MIMTLQLGNQYNMLPNIITIGDKFEYIIVEDQWGRKWKLEPVKNQLIEMPFIITPLQKDLI